MAGTHRHAPGSPGWRSTAIRCWTGCPSRAGRVGRWVGGRCVVCPPKAVSTGTKGDGGEGRGSRPSAQPTGSSAKVSPMNVLQAATLPLSQRPRCFLDNDDLGRLGCSNALLYSVVSVGRTLWAVWDPSVPGGGQWVGSPLALRRSFYADGNTTEAGTSVARQSHGSHHAPEA